MSGLALTAAFFLIAFFYSLVGFGGGSAYLAVLTLGGVPYQSIPATALACNTIVALCSFGSYYGGGYFHLRKVLPFLVLSIPMAFVGGQIPVGKKIFSLLLGLVLAAAAARFLWPEKARGQLSQVSPAVACAVGLPLGAVFGFVSGLVGIGGGIFLSPFLVLAGWATLKEAAACSSFFILLNSLAGLAGHVQRAAFSWPWLVPLAAAVFLGGQMGSRFGAYRLSPKALARVLAALLTVAAWKMLREALP